MRSSFARRLGIDADALLSADRNVEGIVEMMLDAIQKLKAELMAERLFGWYDFPTERSNMKKITWEPGAMPQQDRCKSSTATGENSSLRSTDR